MIPSQYSDCVICPRLCRSDRTKSAGNYCGENADLRIALACIHFGEEPPVSGTKGSGTIFFSGCSLRCNFCQNWQLNRTLDPQGNSGLGKSVSIEEFADLCLLLEKADAENINLVTGTHFTPKIIEGLQKARQKGMQIPALWNSSGFETIESVQSLLPWIDLFLPDLKTIDSKLAQKFFHAPEYPQKAMDAITTMIKGKPLVLQKDQIKSGVIVRHLVLPDQLNSTRQVLEWFSQNLLEKALLSLMFQYTPIPALNTQAEVPSRTISWTEYNKVLDWVDELNIEQGYIQDFSEESTENPWLPDFLQQRPFPSQLSKPLWHYQHGLTQN